MRVGIIDGFQNPSRWRIPWPDLYARTIDLAEQAEELGLDYLWLTEHHFVEDGYSPSLLPIAAAVASRTKRIRIGTKALLLPFHNPLLLAEEIATVDIISNGRLEVGLAAGYRPEEFQGFGVRMTDRGSLMDEGLEVLTRALQGEEITFHGKHWDFQQAQIHPPPVQVPFPLWLGGRTRAALSRAARFGCHLQYSDFSIDRDQEDWRAYSQALESNGRDPSQFRTVSVCSLYVDQDRERAWKLVSPHLLYQQRNYREWMAAAGDREDDRAPERELSSVDQLQNPDFLIGDPDGVRQGIRTFCGSVRLTDFSFWLHLPGMNHDQALKSLELFALEVLPELHSIPEPPGLR